MVNLLRKIFFVLLLVGGFVLSKAQSVKFLPTRYNAEKGAITGHNLNLYNNRPLYCNNTNAFILTGDKPLIRLVQTPFIHGAFMMAYVHNKKAKYLKECSSILTAFTANKMKWTVTDSSFKNVRIILEVVPMKGEVGMAIHASVEGYVAGDELIWIYGGAEYRNEGSLSWKLDISGDPKIGEWDFVPASCKNNIARINGSQFIIQPVQDSLDKTGKITLVSGTCSDNSNLKVSDASLIASPLSLTKGNASELPLISGNIKLSKKNNQFYWAIKPANLISENKKNIIPLIVWQQALQHANELANRIVVQTPDKKLNALASVSVAAIDATWYEPVFVHGAMLWNIPFPGWRTIYGGTMYGWHDRVKKEAAYYTSFQIKESNKTTAKADTALLLTAQDTASRFFGKGRINKDQFFYNFQSQFFDQLITEWRSTGDIALQNMIRPALELHLQWQQECFDADGDGIYESYLNGWPTDSQWYNGGGTAEETSYAYRGHVAAKDMAKHGGDTTAVNFHNNMLNKIRKAFFEKLWITKKGHSGAYREQGAYERLHEDPWLYSIFLPIDVSLVSKEQAAASLYYTQSVLQNDKMPAGGRRVWASNWVPAIFSVREMYPGDNYHLALAYFISGLGDDGWDIMKGTFLEGAFNSTVPGNMGVSAGTDFNDCSSMFTRVLVEGLFGYRPDYPNGIVKIAPQFPKGWDSASIKTPDYNIRFKKQNNTINYSIGITQKADLDLYLPLNAGIVKNVLVDGKPVKWELVAGYGQTVLHLLLTKRNNAVVKVIISNSLKQFEAITIEKNIGDKFRLSWSGVKIIAINDEQKVLEEVKFSGENLQSKISNNPGHHTILIKVLVNQSPQWRIVHLKINDAAGETFAANKKVNAIPAKVTWDCLDMKSILNADVRTIYQQQYISPRPNTVSARIGSDGYSPWTFLYWKNKVPVIKLDSVKYLMQDSSRILTKQQVPFNWVNENKNIAFTSLWDNWPKEVSIPVNKKGEAVWLMVCGSTNPMQCHIANAIVKMKYADGSTDTLELVPPYNYWTLAAINSVPGAAGQMSRNDYTATMDSFCVPKPWPETIQLGENCRAMLLNRKLKKGIILESISLQTLSQEVVIGLMGVTIMNVEK